MIDVVTLTPVSIQADSRTFKQAASVARFGYRSIVVEGQPSNSDLSRFHVLLYSTIKGSSGEVGKIPVPDLRFQNLHKSKLRTWAGRIKSMPGLAPFYFMRFLISYAYQYIVLPLKILPKASLYYLHAFYQFPAIYWMSKKYHVPFIYDAHDFYQGINPPEDLPALERWFIYPFYRVIEAQCVKRASAVVTVNESIAQLIRKEFGRDDIVILRNLHDPRIEFNPKINIRDQIGISRDDFLLVCVGQAKKAQAFQSMLEAMVELPGNVHLAFVGKNHEPRYEMIRAFKLEKRVHIIASVRPEELVPFMRDGDISIILYYALSPDLKYCLPNGLFQSIAAELPLLYPELPEIVKIAQSYDIGLPIDPESPKSISEGVLRLMQDPTLISKYKLNLKLAQEELGWDHAEQSLRGLIEQVLQPIIR